jgi:predicted transcriptional regulator
MAKKFDLDSLAPVIEDEDEKTLAAIDEGIRNAQAGQTTPIEEVRKLLHKWVSLKF